MDVNTYAQEETWRSFLSSTRLGNVPPFNYRSLHEHRAPLRIQIPSAAEMASFVDSFPPTPIDELQSDFGNLTPLPMPALPEQPFPFHANYPSPPVDMRGEYNLQPPVIDRKWTGLGLGLQNIGGNLDGRLPASAFPTPDENDWLEIVGINPLGSSSSGAVHKIDYFGYDPNSTATTSMAATTAAAAEAVVQGDFNLESLYFPPESQQNQPLTGISTAVAAAEAVGQGDFDLKSFDFPLGPQQNQLSTGTSTAAAAAEAVVQGVLNLESFYFPPEPQQNQPLTGTSTAAAAAEAIGQNDFDLKNFFPPEPNQLSTGTPTARDSFDLESLRFPPEPEVNQLSAGTSTAANNFDLESFLPPELQHNPDSTENLMDLHQPCTSASGAYEETLGLLSPTLDELTESFPRNDYYASSGQMATDNAGLKRRPVTTSRRRNNPYVIPGKSSASTTVLTESEKYVCDHTGCNKTFSKRGSLKSHAAVHTGESKLIEKTASM